MKTTDTIKRTTALTLLVSAFFCFVASNAARADSVRFVVQEKSGEFAERTLECEFVAFSREGIEFKYQVKGQEKTQTLSPDQVLALQFLDEPLELSTARVEIEVGNYEEALEKIAAIEPTELESSRDFVRWEIAWLKAFSSAKLALSDAAKIAIAVKELSSFIKEAPESCRYYDACALLGDTSVLSGKLDVAGKFYAKLEESRSAPIRSRGKVGRATVALLSNDLDQAETLFSEVVDSDELDAKFEALSVRTTAKIGLARTLTKREKFDEAQKTLEDLLDATPNGATLQQASIYDALGEVYVASNRPEEAIVAYLHIDLLYPTARAERVKALKALVGLWRQVGREDRAIETETILRERFNVEQ